MYGVDNVLVMWELISNVHVSAPVPRVKFDGISIDSHDINLCEIASISEYFEGKDIFITGGSGFIGKVLIEKILRSGPAVGKIYFLLREKRGKSIEERLAVIKNMAIFDTLRKSDPSVLNKIIPINGNVTELQLGEELSEKIVMTKILMSLPERYKHFRSAWEYVPIEKQTLDELTSRLLIEEERVKSYEGATAFAGSSTKKKTPKK
ncbi:hypothetical protein JTB14_007025 [Gonioctena quinquepunctata]|nr:hypothetical protein JTB14_007025 [Gonioctena quinquepunctata]